MALGQSYIAGKAVERPTRNIVRSIARACGADRETATIFSELASLCTGTLTTYAVALTTLDVVGMYAYMAEKGCKAIEDNLDN